MVIFPKEFEPGRKFSGEGEEVVFQLSFLSPECSGLLQPVVESSDQNFAPIPTRTNTTLVRLEMPGIKRAIVEHLHQQPVGQWAEWLNEVEYQGGRAKLMSPTRPRANVAILPKSG